MNSKPIDPAEVERSLEDCVGRNNAITAVQLWHRLTGERVPDGVAARRMRSAVVDLREAGVAICSGKEGYYLASSVEELETTCQLLFKRGLTALRQVAALKKKALPDLAGQLDMGVE